MGRLFLKLWVLVLLTSLLAFHVQRTVYEWTSEKTQVVNSNERFRRMYVLIDMILCQYPMDQWPTRFEEIKKRVGSEDVFLGPSQIILLVDLERRGDIGAEGLARVRANEPYFRNTPDGRGYEIYHLLNESKYVGVLKAPFARQPVLIFGVFTSTQFTWLVESTLYAIAILLWLKLFWNDMLRLESEALRVGEGKFDGAIAMRRGAALKPLADALDAMKYKISALLQSHRSLTNAVSHEFRTPISRLRFRHELALSAPNAEDKDVQLLAMSGSIDQLDDLARELLEYARLECETPKIDVAPIDVAAWLEELTEDAREVAQAEHRSVSIAGESACAYIEGDYRYLTRAAGNLLRNSVRNARAHIKIGIGAANGKHVIAVEDDGPGIPVADRLRVLEPFARLDASRGRDSGGFGIGLAIVKQVARWHGGTVEIGDSPLGGACVTITW